MNKLPLLLLASATPFAGQAQKQKPNVVFILADDLGFGDVGFNGQQIIKTPTLDSLAKAGIQFSDFYAGCSVSAPSRASLMTGLHTGHTKIRGNKEVKPEGQAPMADRLTLGRLFQSAGYETGIFGKWGLGSPGSGAEATDRGFDAFTGYNCQRLAHYYYPEHLWQGKKKLILDGNAKDGRQVYAPQVIQEDALKFMKHSVEQDKPFFAMLTYTLPHAELNLPHDASYEYYEGKVVPRPYKQQGEWDYPSTDNAHASFAAMIAKLDSYVAEVVAQLKALGVADNTIIVFTSDNGPHREGGADPEYFNSNGPFRGFKRDLYEGGIRVPAFVTWANHIKPNSVSNTPLAFWDFLPTFADLVGYKGGDLSSDGTSFLSVLKGKAPSKGLKNRPLYWEFHEGGGRMAMRKGVWKLIALQVNKGEPKLELYRLDTDPSEKQNLAEQEPERVKSLYKEMLAMRTQSADFPFNFETDKQ